MQTSRILSLPDLRAETFICAALSHAATSAAYGKPRSLPDLFMAKACAPLMGRWNEAEKDQWREAELRFNTRPPPGTDKLFKTRRYLQNCSTETLLQECSDRNAEHEKILSAGTKLEIIIEILIVQVFLWGEMSLCGRSLQGQCFESVRNKSLYRRHFRMLEKSLVYSFPSSRCFLVSNGHIFQCPCFQILLLSWYFLVRNVYASSSRWFLASTDTIFQCPLLSPYFPEKMFPRMSP